MKSIVGSCLLLLLVAGCATTSVGSAEYDGSTRFVNMPLQVGNGAPGEDNWQPEVEYARWIGQRISPVEPMPFGSSMHGPWNVGPDFLSAKDELPHVPLEFTHKPLHDVLHFAARRASAKLHIADNVPNPKVNVVFRKVSPREVVMSLCKVHRLSFIEEGNVWAVTARNEDIEVGHVLPSEFDGRFDVEFEDYELVAAIMETARVTREHVFVPSMGPAMKKIYEERTKNGEGWEWIGPPPAEDIRHITLVVEGATADHILRKLARLGGMTIEIIEIDDAVGYRFRYRE